MRAGGYPMLKGETKRERVLLSIDIGLKLKDKLSKIAKKEHRSLTKQVEHWIDEYPLESEVAEGKL